jgi:hypothetical protein
MTVAKRKDQPPSPEERQAATETALHSQAVLARKVLAGLAADATGNDPVVRCQAQKLFMESWLASQDRNEMKAAMDRLSELMARQQELQQGNPLP